MYTCLEPCFLKACCIVHLMWNAHTVSSHSCYTCLDPIVLEVCGLVKNLAMSLHCLIASSRSWPSGWFQWKTIFKHWSRQSKLGNLQAEIWEAESSLVFTCLELVFHISLCMVVNFSCHLNFRDVGLVKCVGSEGKLGVKYTCFNWDCVSVKLVISWSDLALISWMFFRNASLLLLLLQKVNPKLP